MGKKRWHKRLSVTVLAAILAVNYGGANISARAETVSAVEESIQAGARGLTASPSDAEKTEKPESTKLPEISAAVKETGSAMYADAAEDTVYTISHASGGFSVNGGALTDTKVATLTEAVKKILEQSATKKVAIHFDNIVSSENNGIQLDTPCELTLTGSYKAEGKSGALFNIKSPGCFTIHNTANITISYYQAIINSKGTEVIFEHNGGTLTHSAGDTLFNLKTNDKVYLTGGTINGNVFGNNNGYVEISDGVWNGSLSSVKEVKMIGGRLENCKAGENSIYAIRGAKKISINGGKIYAENTNTESATRAAYAISMATNTKLTLSGVVDISALCNGGKQGSLYYYDSGSYPTVDATGLTSINSGFILAPYYAAMKSSSALTNWMACSDNIQSLLGNMQLNVICPNAETQAEYANYELKAAGNYIRILDKNAPVSQINKGVIKKADIQLSDNGTKYDVTVTYASAGEGTEEKNYQYDKTSGSVSGILNDILLMNTGAAGPQITIGSTANPISEDITIDTAGFIEENAVVLEGKIEGRVTVTGKGTLKSSLSCSGFNGATSSTIHITGGEIIGKESTDWPVIWLSAANLIVEGDSTVIRNANQSSGSVSVESLDTISATGGVQITIRGGTIESSGGRALYLYRKGDSTLAESYASLLVEGGTITGAKYGIYNTEHNEVTIKGGTIQGTESDIFLAHDITQSSREPKKFTVENESPSTSFPFAKMQIENLSNTNEIDFTKAKLNSTLSIVLNSGAVADKLFRVSTKEYRSFLKEVQLSGPAAPVCVVYNSAKPQDSPETTDIYAFPTTEQRTVHVKYYNKYTDTEPFYDEYLLNRYTVNAAEPISSYLSKTVPSGTNKDKFSVWRYKDDIRKGTAADETITVNQLVDDSLATEANNAPVVELYAGYKVSLTGSSSVNGDSSISFQATSDGTTLYYTEKTTYSTYSGEELRAAAKAENTRADFQSLSSENGNFTIPYTNLEPGQSYSCIMVAENENLDVSDALKLTATTNNRVLKKDDFSIGETKFTYAGNQATHGVSVTPTLGNSGKFEIGSVLYKKKEGEKYTGGFLGAQAAAGVYGVFVTTKSEATGINRATDLFLCDMTIEKAKFDPSWFKTLSKITYGEDVGDALKPKIRGEYSAAGATAVITGYGEISYKLYEDDALTKEVSRNSSGHYDVCLEEDGTVGQYYVGVTCTEGSNVKAQERPAAIYNNQLMIEKADHTFTDLTCENIYYGESPSPKVHLQNADSDVAYTEADAGPVRFTYTKDSSGSDGAVWSAANNVGKWYVRAEIDESRNFNGAKSEWMEFTVDKAELTVTAKDLRIPVKSEIPEYKAVYKGFAGADNAASLGGNLQFNCSYTKESEVGTYKIMPYGLTSENYELCFVEGTLTVEEKSGGGSSSGGGGSSSGGSSSKNDSTIIDRPDKDNPTTPTTPTTAETKTVKADKKGNVGITKSMVSDAISTAQADAKKNGNTANGIEVVVPVKISKTLNGVQITLKANALDKLVSSGVKCFTIDADRMADFGFTLDTLKKLNQQTSGNIVLKVKKITVTSVKAKAAIKKRPVYDISLWEVKNVKKTKLTNLWGKTISIAIPYTPKKNEQPGNLYAVFVNGKGKPQWITRSSYDADQKAVIFELTKSGVYGVGYKAKKPVLTDINNH